VFLSYQERNWFLFLIRHEAANTGNTMQTTVKNGLSSHVAPAVALLAGLALAACRPEEPARNPPLAVKATTVALASYAPTVMFTGEIRARTQSDLSFRVSGRIIERNVDVGAQVSAGQVLARIDPREQEANVAAARASLDAAEASLRQVSANFERQKTLLARGFTTRRDYDQAEEAFQTAQGSVESARAQLATARDQLSYTMLRAEGAGLITARTAESGQVVQAAQAVFTIAQDGARDAVFNVQESLIAPEAPEPQIEIALLSDLNVTAVGTVREVAPTLSAQTGTILVKVGLDSAPPAMELGAAVKAVGRFRPRDVVLLPWNALSSQGGKPAVWVVDTATSAVKLQPVTIGRFDSGRIVVLDGLAPGQIVVTAGAQLLRPGQVVALAVGDGK
jgi:membrane fusion protein, multidrug efflux system